MDYLINCFGRGKVHRAPGNTIEEKAEKWRDCSSGAAVLPVSIFTIIIIIIMYFWIEKKFNNKLIFLISIIPILLISYGLFNLIKYSHIQEADKFEELWKLQKQRFPGLTVSQFIIEAESREQYKELQRQRQRRIEELQKLV